MSEQTLLDEAVKIAKHLQTRALTLERELHDIESRKRQIEAEFHAAKLCRDRLSRFRPEIAAERQCPRCWLRDEAEVALTALEGTDELNIFWCNVCRFGWTEPV